MAGTRDAKGVEMKTRQTETSDTGESRDKDTTKMRHEGRQETQQARYVRDTRNKGDTRYEIRETVDERREVKEERRETSVGKPSSGYGRRDTRHGK